jgi:hypothetical protein
MFSFFFLLKGGLIVAAIRKLFMMVWNNQIKNIITTESGERGYILKHISKPKRKERKNSPFIIDANHVNDGGDWIYYRLVDVFDTNVRHDVRYWVKIVLNKEGAHSTDWRLIISTENIIRA